MDLTARTKSSIQSALMFAKRMSKTKRLSDFENNKNSCYMHLEQYNYIKKWPSLTYWFIINTMEITQITD